MFINIHKMSLIELLSNDIVKEIFSFISLTTDTLHVLTVNKQLAQLAIQSMFIDEIFTQLPRDAEQRGWLRWFIGPLLITYRSIQPQHFAHMTRWNMPVSFTWMPDLMARYEQQLLLAAELTIQRNKIAVAVVTNYKWCALIKGININQVIDVYSNGSINKNHHFINHPLIGWQESESIGCDFDYAAARSLVGMIYVDIIGSFKTEYTASNIIDSAMGAAQSDLQR
jgi:hypothetical protein